MEDVNDELLLIDIDELDSNDPLAVVDYVEDIYSYYRKMEVRIIHISLLGFSC